MAYSLMMEKETLHHDRAWGTSAGPRISEG